MLSGSRELAGEESDVCSDSPRYVEQLAFHSMDVMNRARAINAPRGNLTVFPSVKRKFRASASANVLWNLEMNRMGHGGRFEIVGF